MDKQPIIRSGPRKIVDCKLDRNGKRLYKVKWEPTWVPAETLSTCQHLVDEFWTFVNNANIATEHMSNQETSPILNKDDQVTLQQKLSEGKSSAEELTKHTMSTSVGKEFISSPRYEFNMDAAVAPPMLLSSSETPVKLETDLIPIQQQELPLVYLLPQSPAGKESNHVMNDSSFSEDGLVSFTVTPLRTALTPTKQENTPKVGRELKMETPGTPSGNAEGGVSNAACLKHIQNFSNPYVTLNIVCIICYKKSSKYPKHWKRHYMTHFGEETPKNVVEGTPPVQKKKRPYKKKNAHVEVEPENVHVEVEENPIKEEPLD